MRACSEDLRQRIVGAVERGKPTAEVAQAFEVSVASVVRFVRQQRERGHLRSQLPPGRPRSLSVKHETVLIEQVKKHRDATLKEHAEMLGKATGHRVSLMTVQRTLLRLRITRKKDVSAE